MFPLPRPATDVVKQPDISSQLLLEKLSAGLQVQ